MCKCLSEVVEKMIEEYPEEIESVFAPVEMTTGRPYMDFLQ